MGITRHTEIYALYSDRLEYAYCEIVGDEIDAHSPTTTDTGCIIDGFRETDYDDKFVEDTHKLLRMAGCRPIGSDLYVRYAYPTDLYLVYIQRAKKILSTWIEEATTSGEYEE